MTDGREKLAELLRRAGLETVADGEAGDVLPPEAAWRPVAARGTEPTVAIPAGHPTLVAEVNARWYQLAAEHGVIDADGAFLIDVAGTWTGHAPRRWTRVRLAEEWDLAGVLGERPGEPEFVTVSADGTALLGVTTEEHDVWFVAVDRVKEWQEETARVAARESAEEREAAWESLLRGPVPPERLRELWAHGLARNPAALDDVRHGLLGLSHHLLWRRLPAPTVDAAIAHPDWRVRALLAEVQPGLTAGQWQRLILGEREPRQRWILTLLAADRRERLTGATYERLTADASPRIREEVTRFDDLPAPLFTALAGDPEPQVREASCRNGWPRLDHPTRQALLADPHPGPRREALLQHHTDHPLSRAAFATEDLGERALEICRLQRDLAEHLAREGDTAQRRALARNPRLSPELIAVLAQDPEEAVRLDLSLRPDITEEQRSAIRVDIDPSVRHYGLDWVMALHDDPEAMRRLAASSHLLVRRSVARARRLPPDVVERLARDEDRVVQLFLAESCDDAPADMLLRVWQWWTGSLTHPDRPRSHPNFPRRGLLRHADDPSPRMRQLALDDPESTAELVECFSRDPDEEVRRRAAADPRLSPTSAIRLLDDPRPAIRRVAARHPALPARVLVRLLRDTRTAEDAAAHPGLPADVMRRMVHRLRSSSARRSGAEPAAHHAAEP